MSEIDSEAESVASNRSEKNNKAYDEVTEEERKSICDKLSTLSFEQLLKMKEELGSRVYNETVFGVTTKRNKQTNFKRANKNRPREMSSKIRIKQTVDHNIPVRKAPVARDPRFDPLCGTYDDKTFKSNYKFLKDVRKQEKKELEKEYSTTTDSDRKKQIKFLIQRMENKIREEEKREKVQQKEQRERSDINNKLRSGEKPVFKKKSVKKLESLIEKYEELKKSNRLQKHIEKRTKKLSQKEHKKMQQHLIS